MKALIFSTLFFLNFSKPVHAQADNWKIYLDSTLILQNNSLKPNDSLRINFKKSLFNDYKNLRIDYQEGKPAKDWKRTFMLYDSSAEIARFDFNESSGSFKLPMEQLKAKLAGHKVLQLFTFSVSKDEKLAAIVRIRRIFICKLVMEPVN